RDDLVQFHIEPESLDLGIATLTPNAQPLAKGHINQGLFRSETLGAGLSAYTMVNKSAAQLLESQLFNEELEIELLDGTNEVGQVRFGSRGKQLNHEDIENIKQKINLES